jgi:diacylglycerol O-acyltransferase
MSSLLAERGPIHVHVGGTIIVEGEPPKYERLLEHVEERLAFIPRYRQRITESPLGLTNPSWEDDANFDLRRHVRHAALPRPGSREQLRELVGRIMSEPLDLARPLWQLYLIEGLEGNRFAALSKTHHALVDGLSAVDVGTILLDASPEGAEVQASEEPWEPDEPSPEMLLVSAATDRIRGPLRAARKATVGALRMPRETGRRVLKTAEGFADLAAGGPSAPPSPLNVEIGRDRRVAWVDGDLQTLKDARRDDATVNDVVLSVCAGAQGRFLERRGNEVPEHLVALVPVSIRRPDEDLELGNRISTIFVPLPLRERDPAERLGRIAADTKRLKRSEAARAASLIIEATGWAPPTLNRAISGAMARPLTWNLVISNVPGPQFPFYLLGRQVEELYPFVPLSPQNHALAIGLISYDGGVFFGLSGDRDALADIDDLAEELRRSLADQAAA